LVLTRHSLPILNERWTCVINLSMFFLLCYDLTTILRSRALHRVLSSVNQYAWRSYMLSRLYRKGKTFRSNLLTYLISWWMQLSIQLRILSCTKTLTQARQPFCHNLLSPYQCSNVYDWLLFCFVSELCHLRPQIQGLHQTKSWRQQHVNLEITK
jgi:hypothetical protein